MVTGKGNRMSILKWEIWGECYYTPSETLMRGWQHLWLEAQMKQVPLLVRLVFFISLHVTPGVAIMLVSTLLNTFVPMVGI